MSTTLTRPTFGDRIRERREHQGLSQRELARKLGIKHPSVGYWESDKHLPRGEHFVPLAKVLGLRTSTLGRWLEDSPLARLPGDIPGYRNPLVCLLSEILDARTSVSGWNLVFA